MTTPAISKLEAMNFEPDELQLLQAAREALTAAKTEIVELRKKVKASNSKTDENGTKWVREDAMVAIGEIFNNKIVVY